jgi:hypothetical protein
MSDVMKDCRGILAAAETLLAGGRAAVLRQVAPSGRLDAGALEAAQMAAHGLAWAATYVEALRQALRWAERPGWGAWRDTTQRVRRRTGEELRGRLARRSRAVWRSSGVREKSRARRLSSARRAANLRTSFSRFRLR